MIILAQIYLAIGLIFIGLYFTACLKLKIKNGPSVDIAAIFFYLLFWPMSIYLITQRIKKK